MLPGVKVQGQGPGVRESWTMLPGVKVQGQGPGVLSLSLPLASELPSVSVADESKKQRRSWRATGRGTTVATREMDRDRIGAGGGGRGVSRDGHRQGISVRIHGQVRIQEQIDLDSRRVVSLRYLYLYLYLTAVAAVDGFQTELDPWRESTRRSASLVAVWLPTAPGATVYGIPLASFSSSTMNHDPARRQPPSLSVCCPIRLPRPRPPDFYHARPSHRIRRGGGCPQRPQRALFATSRGRTGDQDTDAKSIGSCLSL
ncbi:hypothetical protein QBC39DRAFT_333748 [Podospora conica]|nr:hypothetical protein QBC39DRAFT_333748 [Schizothecium conicum]